MSVYVVTKENHTIRYNAPAGRSEWIARDKKPGKHLIYYTNCNCCRDQIMWSKPPHTEDHVHWVAWVEADSIISIGFTEPHIIRTGTRPLTETEQQEVQRLATWLDKRQAKGQLPKRISTVPLKLIVGGNHKP